MTKQGKKMDVNQIAADIVRETTKASTPKRKKNPAAVALGKLGGEKGGPARAKKLSKERRSEIAQKAALARWK
jgi:hypothetical protein